MSLILAHRWVKVKKKWEQDTSRVVWRDMFDTDRWSVERYYGLDSQWVYIPGAAWILSQKHDLHGLR